MPMYSIDYEYKILEDGEEMLEKANIELSANDAEQAEQFGYEYVREAYDAVSDIKVTGVKELVNG